jgi:hypothetical protein
MTKGTICRIKDGKPIEKELSAQIRQIIAWADAEHVVPRDRECPPHERAQQGLSRSERQDVPHAREHPRHGRAADEGQRHEHGSGPMECRENGSGDDAGQPAAADQRREPVHQQGIQRDLLYQAEGKVQPYAAKSAVVRRKVQTLPERKSRHEQHDGKTSVDDGGLSCCGPQIIGTHAKRFRIVGMQQKTRHEPERKSYPGKRCSKKLSSPDKPCDVDGHTRHVDHGECNANSVAHDLTIGCGKAGLLLSAFGCWVPHPCAVQGCGFSHAPIGLSTGRSRSVLPSRAVGCKWKKNPHPLQKP